MTSWQRVWRWVLAGWLACMMVACSDGGGETTLAAESPPAISVQPVSASAVSGTSATFSINASGSILGYQWQRSTDGGASWAAIAGATAATHVLAAVDASMNGQQFRAVISGAGGSVTSSAATLTVTAAATAPAIGVQPAAQTATAGGSASFSVIASGTALAYQWQDSRDGGTTWAAIAGATAATLTLPALTEADNGRRLRVVVSNSASSVTSAAVTLTVTPAPVAPAITSQPASASVTAPASATFAVVAGGTPAPTCQWQQSTNSGATWAAITGATACSYTTPATTTADSGKQFRAVVSNSAGSVNSAAATLNVSAGPAAPTFSAQPQNLAVVAPATATFAAQAGGTPTPTYQWQQSTDGGATFVNINGATAASYTTPATVAGDSGKRFRVVTSNSVATLTSGAAVLTVTVSDVSPLSGRSWRTGQLLVAGSADPPVFVDASVIDDAGKVAVVFERASNSAGATLAVVTGLTNGPGTAPTWAAPVVLDGPVTTLAYARFNSVVAAASPAGNVAVSWGRCVLTNPLVDQFSCQNTVSVSRYLAATGSWEAAALVTGLLTSEAVAINDRGDVLLTGPSTAGTLSSRVDALFMRAAGEPSFRRQLLDDSKLRGFVVRMDNRGQLLLAANYAQDGTTDIVAFRGSIASGLTLTPTVLDARTSAATLQGVEVGLNGQQAIVWSQNNGVRDTWYSAIAGSERDAFAVLDTGVSFPTQSGFNSNSRRLFVTDGGDVLLYDLSAPRRVRWTAAAGWEPSVPMPDLPNARVGFNRRGDYLRVDTGEVGNTRAYDGQRNVMLAAPGYVLGTATQANAGNPLFFQYDLSYARPLLSANGMAFQSILWNFDVLPTPALPAGDGRNSVKNLWGVYLK